MATDDTTTERWEDIPGYEGYYQISDRGRGRGLARVVPHATAGGLRIRERILTPRVDKDGRPRITLTRDGRTDSRLVCHLVAEAFIGPRPEGADVCHGNGDPADNRVENLRYGTRSENMLDRVRHGRHWQVNKDTCPRGHVLTEPNLVAYELRRGHRSCLACARARAHVHRHPDRDLRATADEYYTRIIDPARP